LSPWLSSSARLARSARSNPERARLGGEATTPDARVNLASHTGDVTSFLEAEKISGAILCGHSYGGMVIVGAADRVPDRIGTVVYVDAYVASDGDSC